MQRKSAEKCSPADRLDLLRLTLQSSWADLAARLDLSESMLYQVKSGKKEMSDKALFRLQLAERQAGIAPPAGEAPMPLTRAYPASTPAGRAEEADEAESRDAPALIAERERRVMANRETMRVLQANAELIALLEKDNKELRDQIELLKSKPQPVTDPTRRQSQKKPP